MITWRDFQNLRVFKELRIKRGAILTFETLGGLKTSLTPDPITANIAFNRMFRIPTSTVAAAGSTQTDATPMTTGLVLVTAADATKGVKLPTAVAGSVVIIKNGAAAVLKVWPFLGDGINAIAVNSNYVLAASTSSLLVAYDATTWYSVPLVAS